MLDLLVYDVFIRRPTNKMFSQVNVINQGFSMFARLSITVIDPGIMGHV